MYGGYFVIYNIRHEKNYYLPLVALISGGYFASITSGYIPKYDSSEKYEIEDGLSLKQKLAIVALLFGTY